MAERGRDFCVFLSLPSANNATGWCNYCNLTTIKKVIIITPYFDRTSPRILVLNFDSARWTRMKKNTNNNCVFYVHPAN